MQSTVQQVVAESFFFVNLLLEAYCNQRMCMLLDVCVVQFNTAWQRLLLT